MIALSKSILHNVAHAPCYLRHAKRLMVDGLPIAGQLARAMEQSMPGYNTAIVAKNLSAQPERFALTGCKLSGVPPQWAKYVNQVLCQYGWLQARKTLLVLLYGSYSPDQIASYGLPNLSVFHVKVGPTITKQSQMADIEFHPKRSYEVVFMAWPEVEMN